MLKEFILKIKRLLETTKLRLKDEAGFTLTEMLAVITIVGILSTIAVPSVIGAVDKAREEVCNSNLMQLERGYTLHLAIEDLDHSPEVFSQYLQDYGDICSSCDEITFDEGKVQCSGLPDEDNEVADGNTEGTPYL